MSTEEANIVPGQDIQIDLASDSDTQLTKLESVSAQPNALPPEEITAYIDTKLLSPLTAAQATEINRALTRHVVFPDQEIANVIGQKIANKELMRLDRGATVIDRIKENVKMPDFRDKLKKLAWNGLKYGYWGFFAYGVITGTSPLGLLDKIGGGIKDFLANTFEAGPAKTIPNNKWEFIKPAILDASVFDTPVFGTPYNNLNPNILAKSGSFYNLFKPLLGGELASKLTRTVGVPFVGLFGSLAKHTKYPVEGKWGPFLAYPAIYYGGKKLGVWNELYNRLKSDSLDSVNQMKTQEIATLKEKARNVLLSGDWEGYSEIRLAIDNIGKRYKGIEDQLIRQRRALAA